MKLKLTILLLVCSGLLLSTANAREWSDKSGHYKVVADLVARNDHSIILETKSKKLLSVDLQQLSERDQKYLTAKEDEHHANPAAMQTWHLGKGDLKVQAAVVEYGTRRIVIQRRRGRVYVNDKRFDKLPGVYKKLVPDIVAMRENVNFKDEHAFKKWVHDLKGAPKSYVVDGVMLELENGDHYGMPFFYFTEEDRKLLEPGWDAWHEADADHKRKADYSLNLRATAIANRRQQAANRQVARLQLQLQAYDAGVLDLWEVGLRPVNGRGSWQHVVVPARDSAHARVAAARNFPQYQVTAVAKALRRN